MVFMDNAWKHSMTLRYDFNHMMDIDPSGQDSRFAGKVAPICVEDIEAMMPRIERARRTLAGKWGSPSRMLAWTKLPTGQKTVLADIERTARRVRQKFECFVVLGVGGSALGPIAVHQALRHLRYNELPAEQRGGPRFYVLDNVDPDGMAAVFDIVDIEKTCFNVITKSGSTSETMAQLLLVTDMLRARLGDGWRKHIIATTDRKKGSLNRIARENSLKTLTIPDGVGGRFSQLSPVGLLPAAVCGIDVEGLLAGAAWMDELCRQEDLWKNPGWMSGVLQYLAMEKKGKNIQVMMPYADSLRSIADWYAQLWAESLGKKHSLRGKVVHVGQTPVKALGVTDQHSQVQLYTEGPFDKVITLLGVERYGADMTIPGGFEEIPGVSFLSGHTFTELIQKEQLATEYALTKAGKLNQTITLPQVNAFTVGQLLYFFMVQTAVAGELLGINAFDQPGVEEGKDATYALLGRPMSEKKKAELDAQPKKNPRFMI